MTDLSPEALLRLADLWETASREWYDAHRLEGTAYACGFEDGWDCAADLLRQYVNGGDA